MRFISLKKKNKITTVDVLLLLLSHFCTYFSLQTIVFVVEGRKNISDITNIKKKSNSRICV